MNRQDARNKINSIPLMDIIPLERSKGADMYNCPVCGSGTGEHHTGALKFYKETNRVQCYANNCFSEKGTDTLGALEIIWKLDETATIIKAGQKLGFTLDAGRSQAPQTEKERPEPIQVEQPEKLIDHTAFYKTAHEMLLKSKDGLEYLHGRKITDESIEKFNLGYCADWKHSKTPNAPGTPRVIVPRSKYSYLARRIDGVKDLAKQVDGRQKDMFNLEALNKAEIVFVCEGELNAISFIQAGATAIGLGSTTNATDFTDIAKNYPNIVYILALDNDKSGIDAGVDLARSLNKAGLYFTYPDPAGIYAGENDANDCLRSESGVYFPQVVKELEQKAVKIKYDHTGAGMVDSFLLKVKSKDFEPIPTGIYDIDRALSGGFIRKTLVLLGAAPGFGKTCLAQWIFETMAHAGHDCLYLNLEMSQEQLIARALSKISWNLYKKDLSALDIMRGYSWDKETEKAVKDAASVYKMNIAGHLVYNPGDTKTRLDDILQALEIETNRLALDHKPAPVICIDYLQLIQGNDREDDQHTIKRAIFALKSFAMKHDTVILLIMANNRFSNANGKADMESGRDTSAIEYSADVMLGMTYTAIEDHDMYDTGETFKNGLPKLAEYTLDQIRKEKKEAYDKGQPTPAVCNCITVKVNKNRFGENERRAKLIYDGKHSTFTTCDTLHIPDDADENDDWQGFNK